MFICSNRNIMSNWKRAYLKISLSLLAILTFGFSQEIEPPEGLNLTFLSINLFTFP